MGRCGFEWSFELGLYWSTVYRQDEFIPCDRAELGRSTCPWNFFFSVLESQSPGAHREMQ